MKLKKLVTLNEVGALYKYKERDHSYFLVLEIRVREEGKFLLEYAIVYSSEEKKITNIWATSYVDNRSVKVS